MNMELDFVKEMFDSIAPKYDFLNRFLSLRQDLLWRREMVKAAELPEKRFRVLDVACGTCDVALEVARQRRRGGCIVATDFSPGMLALGHQKVDAALMDRRILNSVSSTGKMDGNKRSDRGTTIHLVAGNALSLPFSGGIFHGVFIAFGIRNIMDRKGALKAFYDMLEPGGRCVVLELTTPSKGFFRALYLFYFQRILPAIGGLFSKNQGAYHYLPASVLKFPQPKAFARLMGEVGFDNVRWKGMTFGIVTLFVGERNRAM